MKIATTSWLLLLSIALVCDSGLPANAQATGLFAGDEAELLPTTEPELDELPSTSVAGDPEPEVVRERYENRRVKIEREVVQDEDQNYINHGKWKMWDRQGNVLVEGHYSYNEQNGVWTKIYRRRDAKLLTLPPFDQGQLPFVSQATFKDGQLDGTWVIYDANKRKLCEWEFTNGRRHGRSTWWWANGTKMREINYLDGSIHGDLNEWDSAGTQKTSDTYMDGRRLANKVEYYRDRSKKSEGSVLYPQLVLEQADDWWECTLATYTQEGEPEKHGKWVSWYPNGQRKLEGNYEHDTPNGQFVWWYVNGQKSLHAQYRNGKKHGEWIWWHANGQKSIHGEYEEDDPSSKWLWWQETGKVAQRADFSDPEQQQILASPANAEAPGSPNAMKPTPDRTLK